MCITLCHTLHKLTRSHEEGDMWAKGLWAVHGTEVEAIRLAVFTVSPKIENLPPHPAPRPLILKDEKKRHEPPHNTLRELPPT